MSNQILDDLDSQMLDDWHAYTASAIDTWESFKGNHGQMIIVHHQVIEAVNEHLKAAEPRWPYGPGPEEYRAAVLECFDPVVMDRAFSDTIEQSYSDLYEFWANADELQHEHDAITPGVAPHSTGVWTA